MNADQTIVQDFVFTALPSMQILFAVAMTAFGTFTHFIKKVMKDGTATLTTYWTAHKLPSLMSIIGATLGCLILIHINETSFLSFFGVGYASDSILNKAEKAAEKIT